MKQVDSRLRRSLSRLRRALRGIAVDLWQVYATLYPLTSLLTHTRSFPFAWRLASHALSILLTLMARKLFCLFTLFYLFGLTQTVYIQRRQGNKQLSHQHHYHIIVNINYFQYQGREMEGCQEQKLAQLPLWTSHFVQFLIIFNGSHVLAFDLLSLFFRMPKLPKFEWR